MIVFKNDEESLKTLKKICEAFKTWPFKKSF